MPGSGREAGPTACQWGGLWSSSPCRALGSASPSSAAWRPGSWTCLGSSLWGFGGTVRSQEPLSPWASPSPGPMPGVSVGLTLSQSRTPEDRGPVFCVGADLIFYNTRFNILTRVPPRGPLGPPSWGSVVLDSYGPSVFEEW